MTILVIELGQEVVIQPGRAPGRCGDRLRVMPGQFILGIAGLLLLGAGITVLGGAVWRWRRKSAAR